MSAEFARNFPSGKKEVEKWLYVTSRVGLARAPDERSND